MQMKPWGVACRSQKACGQELRAHGRNEPGINECGTKCRPPQTWLPSSPSLIMSRRTIQKPSSRGSVVERTLSTVALAILRARSATKLPSVSHPVSTQPSKPTNINTLTLNTTKTLGDLTVYGQLHSATSIVHEDEVVSETTCQKTTTHASCVFPMPGAPQNSESFPIGTPPPSAVSHALQYVVMAACTRS